MVFKNGNLVEFIPLGVVFMLLFMRVLFCLSSPLMFVSGNDRVTCHKEVDDNPGDDGEA